LLLMFGAQHIEMKASLFFSTGFAIQAVATAIGSKKTVLT